MARPLRIRGAGDRSPDAAAHLASRCCLAILVGFTASSGCHASSPPSGPETGQPRASATGPSAIPSGAAPASASSVALAQKAPAQAASGGEQCGDLECRLFAAPRDAFSAVLATSPLVLGIGEAHALAGTEQVEPATQRFTRDFLPLLKGRASDVVVELLLPNKGCTKEAEQVREEQKVVTKKQASTDQNDYVALASAARALGIGAHALEPTCEDLARIAGAGGDAVTLSLDVVTRLSRETLERLYQRNLAAHDPRMVVGYGGAMHNDASPRAAREQWSFGPALQKLTGGRYVELDLIVPEFISDSPAWQSLPWVQKFDATAHPESTTLMQPTPGAFVLVFPRT